MPQHHRRGPLTRFVAARRQLHGLEQLDPSVRRTRSFDATPRALGSGRSRRSLSPIAG
jgi:hypothetical protein